MIAEFKLSDQEALLAEAFEREHLACARANPTAIGGHITYKFTPTSIGIGVTVKCTICGKEENITDYGNW